MGIILVKDDMAYPNLPHTHGTCHGMIQSMRFNRRVISAALIVVGITLLIVSYSQVIYGDNLLYCFRLDTATTGSLYMFGLDDTAQPIETLSDVVRSQVYHYNHWHGRALVTGVEQFFSGVSSPEVFYPINCMMIIAMLCMFTCYAIGRKRLWSLWAWAAALIFFLFGTPGDADILTSINLSTNYVWPTVMALGALILQRHYSNTTVKGRWISAVSLAITGWVCGWSHEGICVAVSAMFCFYYLANRNKIATLGFCVASGYWLGTLCLLAAPGNLVRGGFRMMENIDGNYGLRLVEAIRSLFYSNTIWILAIIVVIMLLRHRHALTTFVKRNVYLVIGFAVAMMFALTFFSVEHTYFFVDVFSMIIMIRLIADVYGTSWLGNAKVIPTALVALTCAALIAIAPYQIVTNRQAQTTIDDYMTSVDGLTIVPEKVYPDFLIPFIANWQNYHQHPKLSMLLGKSNKEAIVPVSKNEMDCLLNGKMFTPENRIGQSQFYTVPDGLHYWSNDTIDELQRFWYVVDAPSFDDNVPLFSKISHAIGISGNTDRYPIRSIVYHTKTRNGTFWYVFPFVERKVVDIQPID